MLKLFNMDLHISVIADIKYILKDIYNENISITNWSISGHSWVFGENSVKPDFINNQNWHNIDKDIINKFSEKYYDFLSSFDGFIVTHSPVFVLLYERFNKPIILINSCRYEQPFSFKENKLELWIYLNAKLKELYDKKILTVISNNKADAEYLKLGTGIESYIIPSLCLYTNSKYTGTKDGFIINNNYNIPENNFVFNKKSKLENGYKWQELYDFKGIIHMPYEISTMTIFEQYSANIPLFFPSKTYLKELIKTNKYHFQSRYTKLFGNFKYPDNLKNLLDDNTWVDFWVDNADYYDETNMKYIIYFNNNDELLNLLKTTDLNYISKQMENFNINRKEKAYSMWKKIINNIFYNFGSAKTIFNDEIIELLNKNKNNEKKLLLCDENNCENLENLIITLSESFFCIFNNYNYDLILFSLFVKCVPILIQDNNQKKLLAGLPILWIDNKNIITLEFLFKNIEITKKINDIDNKIFENFSYKKKLYFLTFANKNYMNTDRIAKQIKEFNMFDCIFQKNEDDIIEFVEKHKNLIVQNPVGFGLWIWKPKIIYDLLLQMNDNDIVVYCDAGMYANSKGLNRFKYYLENLNNYSMITFSTTDKYHAQQYVKNDAIMSYYPQFNNEWNVYKYAGLIIIKKNNKTLNFIKEWLDLCENHHFIDKTPSTQHKDLPHYIGNDCDDGLFNLCLAKHKDLYFAIEPDEININIGGQQIVHTTSNINIIKNANWDAFDNIPFQCRRMTPKFGFN